MKGGRVAAFAALTGLATALGGILAPSAQADDTELTPMQRFAACVSGGGQGNVVMLFDTSGSLTETDPDGGRVKAATTTVERLAESLDATPDASVSVSVAGFSTGYEQTLGWTPLTTDSVGAISANLETFATRNRGVDTDYWSAMDGARRELSARAQGQENPCNLLLWFSDGEFNLNVRDNDAEFQRWGGAKAWDPENRLRSREQVQRALDRGQQDLCRAGGLADQLRSLDVITIGIGLAVDAPASNFDLMRGVSTGQGISCGEQTDPQPGEFVMATDVDDLIYGFITALTPGGDSADTPTCVDSVCAEGTRTFVLDGSIGAVSATAKAPIDGTRIFLKTRSGEDIELTQGTGERDLGGASLAWEWVTPRVLTFELTRSGQGDWAGPWGIVFVASEKTDELAKSTITLRGDIAPALLNRDEVELRVGEQPVELLLGTIDSSGQRIDPTTLSEETVLSASLRNGGRSVTLAQGLSKAGIERPITVDTTDLAPGIAELVLTLDVTTQSWTDGTEVVPGTQLEPRHLSIPLVVLPPVDYPTIPSRVSFGATESADPVTVQVPVTGDGCAWLGADTRFTGFPDGLDNAQLTSPATGRESCASDSLELTLTPGGLGNGSLVGTTTVLLAPADSTAEPIAVELAFDLDQNRPVSQPVLWSTLLLVTLLGIAIPVGILYLTKFLTAKIPGAAVLAGSAGGPVSEAHAFTDAGVPITVAQLNLAHLTNRRHVSVAGKTLVAKMGAAPTEPGYVVVETPGPSAGGRGTLQSVRGNARLPLAVQGNWMVELDPQRPISGPVLVTVFTAPGAPGFAELLDDVRSHIRGAVAKLREPLPPEQGAPAADPWGGGGSPQPQQPASADPWGGGSPQPQQPQQPASADPWGGGSPQPQQPQQPAADPWATPRPAPPNDPWANPPGGQRPTSGPSSW